MKLRYRLLLAGTSVAALTACIGLENAKSAVTISAFVIGTIMTNAAIRWCVVKVLIKLGLIHPAIERYWPRVPWRVLQIIRKAIVEKWEKLFRMGKKSTGGFTPTLSTLLLRYHPDNIILGRARLWGFGWIQYVSMPIFRHVLVAGATGGGKSNYLALLIAYTSLDTSMFIIDPKSFFSETILKIRKARGASVFVIDVFGGRNSASCNPIKTIQELNELTGKDFTTIMVVGICKALIPKEKYEKPFFNNKAGEIVAAMILHEITIDPNTDLIKICKRVFAGYSEEVQSLTDGQQAHLVAMARNPAFDGFIANIARLALSTDPRTLSNIMATATAPLMWLMHQQSKDFLVRHDFSLLAFKSDTNPITVALACTPFELRTTYAGYFRMMVYLILKTIELNPNKPKKRLRLILEEFQNIGAVDGLPEVWPLLRGFGAMAIAAIQTLEGLRKTYPEHFKTIVGSCDVSLWLQNDDIETNEHTSKKLGMRTLADGKKQEVLDPEQIPRFCAYTAGRGGDIIAIRAGKRALALRLVEYFRDCPVSLYLPDPAHPEPAGRVLGRKLVAWFRAVRAAKSIPESQNADEDKLLAIIARRSAAK